MVVTSSHPEIPLRAVLLASHLLNDSEATGGTTVLPLNPHMPTELLRMKP